MAAEIIGLSCRLTLITLPALWQLVVFDRFFPSTQLRPQKSPWKMHHHGNAFSSLKTASFAKTKDPLVKISLDNYATIFGVTPTGIVRYLRLVTPVDREKQMTYTFTVRLHFHPFFCVLFCVLKESHSRRHL